MGNNETSEIGDDNYSTEERGSQDSGNNLHSGRMSNEWYNINGTMPCPEGPHTHVPFE